MTDDDLSDLKRREEAKRERCWDPAQRWRVLQETITWAESIVHRNTREQCLAHQRRLLAALEQPPQGPNG